MIHLNIIPNELKHEKKIRSVFESLRTLFLMIIILLSFYAIILLAAELVLQFHFIDVMQKTGVSSNKDKKNYSAQVRDIKDKIKYVSSIQADSINWSLLIEYIANNTGQGVKFSKISINKVSKSLIMEGFAVTRNDLIQLKTTLENSNYFVEVEFPIKNLLEKDNINFSISAIIKNHENFQS